MFADAMSHYSVHLLAFPRILERARSRSLQAVFWIRSRGQQRGARGAAADRVEGENIDSRSSESGNRQRSCLQLPLAECRRDSSKPVPSRLLNSSSYPIYMSREYKLKKKFKTKLSSLVFYNSK